MNELDNELKAKRIKWTIIDIIVIAIIIYSFIHPQIVISFVEKIISIF
jgi:hypothetical protein